MIKLIMAILNNLYKKNKSNLKPDIRQNEDIDEFKYVKIFIRWSTFGDDIIENDIVKVPIYLNEQEEKKFIDKYVEDNWDFAY